MPSGIVGNADIWTDDEVAILRAGGTPDGRTLNACRSKRQRLGIRLRTYVIPPEEPGQPAWWRDAQRLRAAGFNKRQVAKRMGRSVSAVEYATEPKRRAYYRKAVKRIRDKYRSTPEGRARLRADRIRYHKNKVVRDYAADVVKATNRPLRFVTQEIENGARQ